MCQHKDLLPCCNRIMKTKKQENEARMHVLLNFFIIDGGGGGGGNTCSNVFVGIYGSFNSETSREQIYSFFFFFFSCIL